MKKKLKLEDLKVSSFISAPLYGGTGIGIQPVSNKIGCDTALCGPSRVSACPDCEVIQIG